MIAGNRLSTMHEDTVVCEGVAIPYRYCHSRRRTLGMTIRPDKSVSVRVPLRTPLHAIRDFVARQAAWIEKVRQKLDAQRPVSEQSYTNGATFLFQGTEYRLALEQGPVEGVQIRGGSLVVTMSDHADPGRQAGLVARWYREQALEMFRERMIACHRMFPAGTPLPQVVIRPMKSRWGSYSYRTRRICLNLNLIKLPQPCLDYVIVHELCHIEVRHHGPSFWRLVARYVPDHGLIRRQLRTLPLTPVGV
ncbi:MAG: hypothetical protein CXR30_05005 [Geobacter sp.]|nr:MAG: hypothetical protein CXR30_05005 [Geobacter sp.]